LIIPMICASVKRLFRMCLLLQSWRRLYITVRDFAGGRSVWSKAPVIVGAHDTGPLIRSKDGFWLAIPTEAAGRGVRGAKLTPGEWERRRGLRLRFVYRRRGPSLLVADRARINNRGQAVASRAKTGRNQATAPIFLLVPQAKLPKRLDLDRDAEWALDSVPGLIVANWVEGKL
jgi:hypothetical protein